MNNLSSQINENSSAFCPSCERFIGAADVCPYCGTDSARNPILRKLRYAAFLLGIVGLFFLYMMATHKGIPVIEINEITPMMNFAHVRVIGIVERSAYIAKKAGRVNYLSFSVNDGSGALRIAAYRNVSQKLVEKNLVPPKGVKVDVSGSLSVSAEGKIKLILQTTNQLHVVDE